MNWQHLWTLLWLRTRLLVNQWRRGGTLSLVLMMIFALGALGMAVPTFIGTLVLGLFVIPKAEPVHLLLAWDVLIAGFVFFWSIGLLTELQRAEVLSLSKFMHLPVSVNGAFLINYVSSLFRLTLIIFLPPMLGFALALIVVKGAMLLFVLPLLAGFVLMISALSYQFQGWLATLMSNPRRRRAVLVAVTAGFILIFQLPQLLNVFVFSAAKEETSRAQQFMVETNKLQQAVLTNKIDHAEFTRRQEALMEQRRHDSEQAGHAMLERFYRIARLVNMVLPIGWLPLGVMSAAEGGVLPSLLGLSGMTAIGVVSLWRAYRTTVALYQGQSSSRRVAPSARSAEVGAGHKTKTPWIEARLPGLSEPVSAIALGSFHSLLRAPEAKMMMLPPVIMLPIFGSLMWNVRHTIPVEVRPMLAFGGMAFSLMGLLQLMGNQFGFDRDGFRVYVLCAAPRRDILLGKNLAFAPIAFGLAAILLLGVEILCPLRWDHLLAMVPQYASMFLMFTLMANLMSIYTPLYLPSGALKASNPKALTIVVQLLVFMLLFPLTQAITLVPLGLEALLTFAGWDGGVPIYLLLALLEFAALVFVYRVSLKGLGNLLQSREQRILEVVTNRAA